MIADLKPYPEYKESGLPWLGSVPKHWEVRQARQIGRLLKGVGGTKEDAVSEGVPCVRYGELYTTYTYFIRVNRTFIKPELVGNYMQLQYGDVLFAASGETIEDIGKSAVNLMQTSAVCGGDIIILRPTVAVHPPFLGYAMDCRPATNQKSTMARGTTVKHIYPDELRSLILPLPPPSEQAAIVRFLDWASGRLDRAIRAKRKVIALLNEQKQAIIHRAVTRGLDPTVARKPSGIPWLGDIPEHWEAPRVKQCARKISKGTTPSTEGREILESGPVRFLKAENISGGCITDKPLCFIDDETNKMIRRSQLAENDVLFVIAGATLGKTAVVPIEVLPANTNQAVAFIRPNSRVVPRFLELWLQSSRIKELIWLNAVQSAQPNLSMADLGNFVIPVPPRNEQQQILLFVASATMPISEAISRLTCEIDLLREYRTRLVADVVTGKLDVREAAKGLPVEATMDDAGEETADSTDDEVADGEDSPV